MCVTLALIWCSDFCVPAPVAQKAKAFTNPQDGSEMIRIPAGTFKMGEGSTAHDVQVDEFYISECEVTNKQFKKFVDANPEWRKGRVDSKLVQDVYLEHWDGGSYPSDKANHPVVSVSWFAAKAYCEWASNGGLRGRLPTEAEWEYACRAGSTGKYCFGDDKRKLGDYAWYGKNSGKSTHPVGDENSDDSTHPVGEKKPNAWGLHDMHGNVSEWCSSKYEPYPYKVSDGREGLSDAGSDRVLRGGGWFLALFDRGARGCRSANRLCHTPTFCFDSLGFRVVLSARGPR